MDYFPQNFIGTYDFDPKKGKKFAENVMSLDKNSHRQ